MPHNPNYNSQIPPIKHWGLYTHGFIDKNLLEELRETLDDLIAYELCYSSYMYYKFMMFV